MNHPWGRWLAMILAVHLLFIGALAANDWLFRKFEHSSGINYIFLPAGARLLSPLLFGHVGAVGLLIVSWLVGFFHFFPDDPMRAFMGGIISTAAPYGVYLAARHLYGLQASLVNLTPRRLLVLAFACAVASPTLHHLYFAMQGQENLLPGYTAMVIGDLSGTLIVLYTMKGLLSLLPRRVGA